MIPAARSFLFTALNATLCVLPLTAEWCWLNRLILLLLSSKYISLLAEQICFLKVRSWRGKHFFLRNIVGYRLEDPTMQQKTELGLKQGCSELQQSASLTNHSTAPGQAAQSQQPQHRQLGWQGRGLSYGLHLLFAKRLVSTPPFFFLSNQFKSFITTSTCL